MSESQQDDCPLLRLPGDVLARIVCEAAASQAAVTAPPLCRGDLEADACAKELAGPPYINPERALRLQLSSVCRAFKRALDEGVAWQRLFLDASKDKRPAEVSDSDREKVAGMSQEQVVAQLMREEGASLDMCKDSSPQLAWLAGLREEARRGVRALRLVLPLFPSESGSALRALTADAALTAGLEELDLVVPGTLLFAPVRSLGLLARMRALRSLRVKIGVPLSSEEEESREGKAALAAANGSIAAIASLPRLTELEIGGFSLSAATLRALAASCPALAALRAEFSSSAPGDVCAILAALGGLRRLQRLRAFFWENDELNDDDDDDEFDEEDEEEERTDGQVANASMLRPIAALTELQSLHLELPVSSTEFVSKLPDLRHLSLNFISDVRIRALLAPALAGGLRTLDLNFEFEHNTPFGRRGELDEVLPRLTRLEALNLHAPQLYFKKMQDASLASLTRLHTLSLSWDPPPALLSRVATDLTALRKLRLRGAELAPPPRPAAAALASRLARLVLETPCMKPLAPGVLKAIRSSLPGVTIEHPPG
eukprot:tig00001208_g7523.t1